MTYSGVQSVTLPEASLLTQLYSEGSLPLSELVDYGVDDIDGFPNSYLILQCGSAGAIGRISPDGKSILVIRQDLEASGVKPRNKEQRMLLSTLLDPSIPVQIASGKAGTGKTLIALAAAMELVGEGKYEKIILTKPMSQVGNRELGILPGSLEEKFAPFLLNYSSNIEQLIGKPDPGPGKRRLKGQKEEQRTDGLKGAMVDFFEHYNVEMVPLQLMRGASFNNAFIIADEVQVLDHHEMLTLGTRVASGSKLVLMGDLAQRDEKISREKTGLHKVVNDLVMKKSGLVSVIELVKVERGPVAELFTRAFEEAA